MELSHILGTLIAISLTFFVMARRRVVLARRGGVKYRALPHYYGAWCGLLSLLPAALTLFLWLVIDEQLFKFWTRDYFPEELLEGSTMQKAIAIAKIENIVNGITVGTPAPWIINAGNAWIGWADFSRQFMIGTVFLLALALGFVSFGQVKEDFQARLYVEKIILLFLIFSSCIAIFTTLAIVVSVLFETIRFFQLIPPQDFLFGLEWNPQFEGAERAGSGGGTATYGMVPMFVGTMLISTIALVVAVPVGLMGAIYLAEYASPLVRSAVKPLLEMLAGVPAVVYGFFAALTVAPFIKSTGEALGLTVASESALAAGLVMGIMIIPFVSSLSDDVLNAVPQSLRDAALGLGSTQSEVTRQVVIPAALPGIVAAIILAVSRAIGETMIVVMAAGLAANLSFNPLDSVTTVTSQIVTILVGDQEFESAKTLSAFAFSTVLILITLALNFLALQVVKKYREQYD